MYSCAVPVGRWWPARYTQTRSPTARSVDPLPDGVDHTSAVLVRRDLRERRRCAIAGAEARLPVGGVDTGDDDADPDLARPWFGHVAIDEPENRWVAGARVDDRPHARDNPIILRIIPGQHPTTPTRVRIGGDVAQSMGR